MPNTVEDVEQNELLFIADENAKWYSHFGRQFSCFLQSQIYSYIGYINHNIWLLKKSIEKLCPHKPVH